MLLSYCERQREATLRDLRTLVELESPSTDRQAVNRCGDALASMLERDGARVTRHPQSERGDHLRAEIPSSSPRRVLILGHFDTVWKIGELPIREEGGKLFGPGVFDMKAGLAVALLAARALRDTNTAAPRMVMLFTTDEEIGSGTSRAAIEAEARQADAVLVLEPSLPGGAAKTSRKGCGEYRLTVHGVSAHAGLDPGKGASAIHELAHQIVGLESLRDPSRGISVNVGIVDGGTRANVVADRASAAIDVRVVEMGDAARIDAAFRAMKPVLAGTRLELTGGIDRPPLERSEAVVRLYEQARQVAATLGGALPEGSAGGGSDGNFTAALGVPTLDGLGPRGDGAHARHEHVVIDDLPWRGALLASLLSALR